MPIDETQQEQLFEWLRSKGVRPDCPACGREKWKVGDIIAPPSAPGGGGTKLGGPPSRLSKLCVRTAAT